MTDRLPPTVPTGGDWPMQSRNAPHPLRTIPYSQYLVQLQAAEKWMQFHIDNILADNPGWKLLPSGQFVDADGNDVGMWID